MTSEPARVRPAAAALGTGRDADHRADSGRAATVYVNALTGNSPAGHLLDTIEIPLCP